MAFQNVDGIPMLHNEDLSEFNNCPKKSGHNKFYPVHRFTTKLLPECYHNDRELERLIQVVSDLTVKLEVGYISSQRPKTFQVPRHNPIPYPLSDEHGRTNNPNYGTGIVSQVVENGSAWTVHINTCRHVVFDNLEARNTQCTFSFDFNGYPAAKIDARDVTFGETEKDVCQIVCTVKDKNLAMLLKQLVEEFGTLGQRVFRLYERVRRYERKVIIVSYPHATSKHVTIGNVVSQPDGAGSITYDAVTCPCCSGAYLLVLGGDSFLHTYLHRGSFNDGRNFSTDRLEMGQTVTDLLLPPHQYPSDVMVFD